MLKTDQHIPLIPGRGLVTAMSTKMRLDFLKSISVNTDNIAQSDLDIKSVQKNIESFIGTVELPVGIVGPLLFNTGAETELVYTAAATLEGALVASMNRGAKAISLGGGFRASVLWQKMSRAPMFLFERKDEAEIFVSFVKGNFEEIKKKAEGYSNHACLLELDCIQIDNTVHVKFIYSTGDASGQNMTTTCTWHAMLHIAKKFYEQTDIQPIDFVIDGNGSSDKKISSYSTSHGRGVHVTAECFLPEKIINEVLRTTSRKIEQCFEPSRKLAEIDGMIGYNINVANAIASIYAATGQDLACLHESSIGILNIKRTEYGLYLSLNLPNLVIGTVGGGTHLLKQAEALGILKCKGPGKIERFAKLIAGFALSLEISTYAAVVSGEFAKAHEKLGRNKPADWLLRSELTEDFLKKCLTDFQAPVVSVKLNDKEVLENGILTNVAGRISKKLIGFETLNLLYHNEEGEVREKNLLLKSKALDSEVIKGLHVIAASIDPELSDLINKHQLHLEYRNCHRKEMDIYAFLQKNGFRSMPVFYGEHADPHREIYLFVQEFIDPAETRIMNSENYPEKWRHEDILNAIRVASDFHRLFAEKGIQEDRLKTLVNFEPWQANDLYNKLISLLIKEEKDLVRRMELGNLLDASLHLEQLGKEIQVSKTTVHNDYNPRNIALTHTNQLIIYDWELAMQNYPHRDIIEFLAFCLPENFSREVFTGYLEFHFGLNKNKAVRAHWFKAYEYAVKEFIITRVAFYEVAGIVVKYDFSRRILNTSLRMLNFLTADE